MRKTSHDGGDTSSITDTSIECEIRRPVMGIMKTTRNSIKRKVQNLAQETDDAVIEPLLQKEKLNANQIAKHSLLKTKNELSNGKQNDTNDKDKLITEDVIEPTTSNVPSMAKHLSTFNKSHPSNLLTGPNLSFYNHINSNTPEGHVNLTSKHSISSAVNKKSTSGMSTPLIFTQARIHTDDNKDNRDLEPVHVTTVPILSTTVGTIKMGIPDKPEIKNSLDTDNSNKKNDLEANISTSVLNSNKENGDKPQLLTSTIGSIDKNQLHSNNNSIAVPLNKSTVNISDLDPNKVDSSTVAGLNKLLTKSTSKYKGANESNNQEILKTTLNNAAPITSKTNDYKSKENKSFITTKSNQHPHKKESLVNATIEPNVKAVVVKPGTTNKIQSSDLVRDSNKSNIQKKTDIKPGDVVNKSDNASCTTVTSKPVLVAETAKDLAASVTQSIKPIPETISSKIEPTTASEMKPSMNIIKAVPGFDVSRVSHSPAACYLKDGSNIETEKMSSQDTKSKESTLGASANNSQNSNSCIAKDNRICNTNNSKVQIDKFGELTRKSPNLGSEATINSSNSNVAANNLTDTKNSKPQTTEKNAISNAKVKSANLNTYGSSKSNAKNSVFVKSSEINTKNVNVQSKRPDIKPVSVASSIPSNSSTVISGKALASSTSNLKNSNLGTKKTESATVILTSTTPSSVQSSTTKENDSINTVKTNPALSIIYSTSK